jgi:hypothetical protein
MTKTARVLETRSLPKISTEVYETLQFEANGRNYTHEELLEMLNHLTEKNPNLGGVVRHSVARIQCTKDALFCVLAVLKLVDAQLEVNELERISI